MEDVVLESKETSFEEEFIDDHPVPTINSVEIRVTPPSLDKSSTILVENLCSGSSHKEIHDFFSFCGTISALSLTPDPKTERLIRAVITFASPSSARVALLLNSSVFRNNTITVTEIPMVDTPEEAVPGSLSGDMPQPIPSSNDNNPPLNQTEVSVIESLINKGYQLSSNTLQKAKEFNPTLTSKLNQHLEEIQKQVDNLDRTYQVTEKSQQLSKSISEGYKQVDNSYNISGNIELMGNSVYGFLSGATQTVTSSINYASSSLDQYIESHPEIKTKIENVKNISVQSYKQISDIVTLQNRNIV